MGFCDKGEKKFEAKLCDMIVQKCRQNKNVGCGVETWWRRCNESGNQWINNGSRSGSRKKCLTVFDLDVNELMIGSALNGISRTRRLSFVLAHLKARKKLYKILSMFISNSVLTLTLPPQTP